MFWIFLIEITCCGIRTRLSKVLSKHVNGRWEWQKRKTAHIKIAALKRKPETLFEHCLCAWKIK